MRKLLNGVALAVLALAPQLAAADDAALIIVQNNYRRLADVAGATRANELSQALRAEGFEVTIVRDRASSDALEVVQDFRRDAADADRVLVLMSGHMVTTARETYLLTRNARSPTDLTVGNQGVPMGPILDTLAEHPGQAVIMLAPSGARIQGTGLATGASPDVPQGVTMFTGPMTGLLQVARQVLLVPGEAPRTALANPPRGVSVRGFLSDALPFLPDATLDPTENAGAGGGDPETVFWQVAQMMATVDAYEAYLDTYPYGRFTRNANDAIDAIEGDEQSRLGETEEALGLNREARRDIQRHLAILGFDPRGIDGLFGGGTRNALAAWQRAEGFLATGYLDGEQLRTLRRAGQERAAELEAEAEARRAEQERQDRTYWRQTGRGGTEDGLRDYLERYPDGLFADRAQARLDEYEAEARAQAEAEERSVWDETRTEDSAEAYTRYLRLYPNGGFADAARARLDELTAADDRSGEVDAAKADEARIAGNRISALLIETRLAALGFEPGTVNGEFDRSTRRAIRKFQRARGISVTGYIDGETMAHLLSTRR